jgi:hypothetical protein
VNSSYSDPFMARFSVAMIECLEFQTAQPKETPLSLDKEVSLAKDSNLPKL